MRTVELFKFNCHSTSQKIMKRTNSEVISLDSLSDDLDDFEPMPALKRIRGNVDSSQDSKKRSATCHLSKY